MDDLAEFKQTYFQECEELLADLEGQLTALQDGRHDDEVLHAAFRAIHSIKGGAGAFGFERLVSFAHVFETVLDLMRSHRLEPDGANIALLIRANDVLADLVGAAQAGRQPGSEVGRDVLAQLHELAGDDKAANEADDEADLAFTPVASLADEAADRERAAAAAPGPPPLRTVRIQFRPRPALFQRANEPLLLLRALKELGTLRVEADAVDLPPLAELEPDGAYLAWTLALETAAPQAAIEEVFEFVADDCALAIEDERTKPAPEEAAPVERSAPAAIVGAAGADGEDGAAAARGGADKRAPATIRVDLERIDRLVNMVGELVITQAMISEQAGRLSVDQHAALLHGVEALNLQMRELQENVMAIRAQPVKSVFARMTRLVRELSATLGKEARLVITGEHTEVDKTVIEELSDPLTHMIRNSMDHGLEIAEERRAAGKPPEGVIHLAAEHRSGRIVISVSDDGRGINRPRVLQKAIEKGLVPVDARPSDEEIDNMILLPGFSTADHISNVSGRGVGMDVVLRKIQNMGGRVGIASTPGQGSRITLTLPLTLAVLDGMIVRIGEENYILPITGIVESLKPRPEDIHRVAGGGEVLSIRGDYITLVHLSRLLGGDAATELGDRLVVVVETGTSGRIGLVVDELVGQQQVVIKSLEANYRRVDGVAGATILGNGMVAMILDVEGIRAMALERGIDPVGGPQPQPGEMH
jgi:two-component system chemotaxis sensor kinase CheA